MRTEIASKVKRYGDKDASQADKTIIMNFWNDQKVKLFDRDHYLSKERDALVQKKIKLETDIANINKELQKGTTVKNMIYLETEKLE